MRMSRRAGLTSSVSIPSFATLFSKIGDFKQAGRSSSTAGVISLSPDIYNDETWYLFYCVGPSMEISRIDMADSRMIKTTIVTWAPSVAQAYHSSLNEDGTEILSDDSVYSGNMTILWFRQPASVGAATRIPNDIIDYMFRYGSVYSLKSYYDSTLTNDSDTLKVQASTVSSQSGVCIASFRNLFTDGDPASIFGVMDAQTPTTPIKHCYGTIVEEAPYAEDPYGGFKERSPLAEPPSSPGYLVPTANGTTMARVRSYTLKRFTETWPVD